MKAAFESLHATGGSSFLVRCFREKAFSAPYHFHPELELTLILKGAGKRYVGSNMSAYTAGDLVLLGPNLPHCWKSENVSSEKINASSLVIQFKADFLGTGFFQLTEMEHIHKLLQRSRCGIQFRHKAAAYAKEAMLTLLSEEKPFKKMILLLEILHHLSLTKQYAVLDKQQSNFTYAPAEQNRINNVMAYIVENFRKQIVLEDAARIVQMTPAAFCKYFKRATRKTFIETVVDYRINYATQLLAHTDKPIGAIGFESGFGDASHFYKTFKARKNLSPLNYRKKFTTEIA